MVCKNCERPIPDHHVVYCHDCFVNRPQVPQVHVTETCQITAEVVFDPHVPNLKAEVAFLAEATGPLMKEYIAERSESFTVNPTFDLDQLSADVDKPIYVPRETVRAAKAALAGLITKLNENCWERLGAGDTWFNQRFCRGWQMVKTE